MSAHVVFPKHQPANASMPHVFLMGPIRNAPPWHEEAIEILAHAAHLEGLDIRICSPKPERELSRPLPAECPAFERMHMPSLPSFHRQRAWEHAHLEAAAYGGGIICWLPAPGAITQPDKVYGAISQLELGHWIYRAGQDRHIRFAIGTDGVYNRELHTLLYDIECFAPHLLPLHTSIASLCEQAIRWCKN